MRSSTSTPRQRLEKSASPTTLAYYLTLKGAYFESAGKNGAARSAFTTLTKDLEKRSPLFTEALARIAFADKKYTAVIALDRSLRTSLTERWRPSLMLAQAYLLSDRPEDALLLLKQLRIHWQDKPMIAYYLALAYFSVSDYEKVEEIASDYTSNTAACDERQRALFYSLAVKAAIGRHDYPLALARLIGAHERGIPFRAQTKAALHSLLQLADTPLEKETLLSIFRGRQLLSEQDIAEAQRL